jgi:hypothetical protein
MAAAPVHALARAASGIFCGGQAVLATKSGKNRATKPAAAAGPKNQRRKKSSGDMPEPI